jgi:ectoine hydroxylase-related dioxygenase (phytanoyl-CoA dioxygenase family)
VDEVVLRHLLTDDEHAAIERDGYLMVRGALDASTVEGVLTVAAREDSRYRQQVGVGPHHVLNLHDLVGRDRLWLELVDLPTTFAKVWGILGWHIQLFHTQLIVTPPAPLGAAPGAYGWHQDNNRMNLDIETTPQPRMSLKVGYFLTDLTQGGMGNLCVVPGSHRYGRPDPAREEAYEGAIEIIADAGDAVIFDRRLWHAASTNTSDRARAFVTYGYSYRWMRTKSAMQHSDTVEVVDPIRRQLLGASTSANAYFDPSEEDIPLRAWIRDHLGDRAVTP